MPTRKLYYEDPSLRPFRTKITKLDKDETGRLYAVLEETAFYPTGGGQPHDTGTLNGVQVYDVEEVDGEIRHYTEEPLDEHEECIGEIDWNRRFDHMQQHAGQHILSAAFEQASHYRTVSFHLGQDTCTIDLQTHALCEAEAYRAEELANQIILEDRPMEAKWVTQDELSRYPLRKELSVTGPIRLVIIPDFDYNGCGGTHPPSTGKVSSIKILHWEKQKGNIRVHFVCGNRVLRQLHQKHQVITGLTAILNAPQEQLEESAKRILQQTKELEKAVNELKTSLLAHEADRFIEQADMQGNYKIVKAVVANRPVAELQQLAKSITAIDGPILVMMINEEEDRLQFVCARGREPNISMNQLVKQVLPFINGKGGGNDVYAQGGGDKTLSGEELMKTLSQLLTHT